MATQWNLGLLSLRVVFGVFLAYHGYNKFFGGGRLAGTASWFASIGFRAARWQALMAASTEVGAGVLLAAGLLTPLAAAGVIGVMLVAIVSSHWNVGFFIFKPGGGWEYCASIAVVAAVLALMGPGRWSLDHAAGLHWSGWTGGIIGVALGVGGAAVQLVSSYRPNAHTS
jgi:putative oxidoreductase